VCSVLDIRMVGIEQTLISCRSSGWYRNHRETLQNLNYIWIHFLILTILAGLIINCLACRNAPELSIFQERVACASPIGSEGSVEIKLESDRALAPPRVTSLSYLGHSTRFTIVGEFGVSELRVSSGFLAFACCYCCPYDIGR
jgi:hypothetical protein